jgi:hypothetical protein
MRVIVIGAGGVTRELMGRLGELWDVVVVDTEPDRLDAFRELRTAEVVVGDGSSPLVLKRAGLHDADALIAATSDDDVNLEAARIAQEAGLLRVIGVAAQPERADEYRDLGIEVITPNQDTARRIELELEPRRLSSRAFADGKAEAIEFSISPDAAVRDKALKDLYSETWIVAAVLREGQLIVPHGETQLRAGDRVTVVGAASDFAALVRTFTAGESRFPLSFGRKVGVAMDSHSDLDGPVAEAINLVRNSQAEEVMVVHRDPATERDAVASEELESLLDELRRSEGVAIELKRVTPPLEGALLRLSREESVGVMVVPAPTGRGLLGNFRCARLVNGLGVAGVPILLSRRSFPYSSVVVPARRTEAGEMAGRSGIDVARSADATLVGVVAVEPAFMGSDDVESARRAAAWLREEAAVQGVSVQRRVRRGNPVRVIADTATRTSLVVLGMPALPMHGYRPGITGHLIQRLESSVLLVPQAP